MAQIFPRVLISKRRKGVLCLNPANLLCSVKDNLMTNRVHFYSQSPSDLQHFWNLLLSGQFFICDSIPNSGCSLCSPSICTGVDPEWGAVPQLHYPLRLDCAAGAFGSLFLKFPKADENLSPHPTCSEVCPFCSVSPFLLSNSTCCWCFPFQGQRKLQNHNCTSQTMERGWHSCDSDSGSSSGDGGEDSPSLSLFQRNTSVYP